MKIYNYTELSKQELDKLCLRQLEDDASIKTRVASIVEAVKTGGDEALAEFSRQFDNVNLSRLYLDKADLEFLASTIPQDAKEAIDTAFLNIKQFHAAQIHK